VIRRATWALLRWLAGFAAGLTLAAAFLVWRLSAAPVSLDYLIPSVARGLAGTESGLVVRIDHTLLSLGPGAAIDIVARGVHLQRRDGEARLTLPELDIGFSLRAALHGVVAPTRIVLREPELRLARAADGTIHLGLGAPDNGDWGEQLLRDLAAAPDRQGSFGFLTQVAIRNALLSVDDRALGLAWRARRVDATVYRGDRGVSGDISLTAVAPGGAEAPLSGSLRFVTGESRLSVVLRFAALHPALFAGAAPTLAPLAALELPFSGQVRVELDTAALRIGDAWCDLFLGAGAIVHPALEGGRVAIASGRLRAAYDPAQGRVHIEQLSFDLGGPLLEVVGTVDGVGDGVLAGGWPQSVDLAGELHLTEVPVDALAGLWPERLSPHSRSWVTEHVHDGVVTAAAARFGAHVDLMPDAAKPVRVDGLAGTLDYRNLTIDYFKPLEPLRGVDGTANFDRAHLDLVPSGGAIRGVRLTGGRAKLAKLDTDDEEIAIDAGIKGPLRDVLEVLDTKPLEYAQELQIDPAQVAGEVEGELSFAFPLKHDLRLAMVEFGAKGRLSGVAIGQVIAGRDLSAGELQLRLDRNALSVDGTARLDDVPASVSWSESLKPGGPRARYAVKARLDDAARQRLGLDLPVGVASGPIDVDAVYTVLSPHREAASVSLDAAGAALALAQLDWHKPAGVPASGSLDLDLVDGHIRAIRRAVLAGGGLDARFAVALDDSGTVQRVDLPRLVAGETDVGGTLSRRVEGGWRIELKGASFDATALMSDLDRSAEGERTEPPLVIDASLERLILGPKREARDVKGQLFSDGVHWQAMSIDAALIGNGKASLRFGQAAGDHSFRLTTDDMGALLRLFDVSDNVAGGHLEVTGQVEDSGRRRLFRGKLDGGDYRLVHAPVMARLLSVASLSGISALLSGEGIPFTRLKGDFVIDGGRLELKELRAYGGAIGIKADGVYDLDAQTLDFAGTLVPAYTLNSVLGNIPWLGKIFTGGEGEGIFAGNFRVAGPLAEPQVTVNPLSALAPGVLRKLFLFEAPEPSPPPQQSGSAQPR
jgi:hypothetical protein